jgi:hypothetical protein
MVLLPIPLHIAMVQGVEWEIGYLSRMGKAGKPHSCCTKGQTQIQYSFSEPVAAGRQEQKDMDGCEQML